MHDYSLIKVCLTLRAYDDYGLLLPNPVHPGCAELFGPVAQPLIPGPESGSEGLGHSQVLDVVSGGVPQSIRPLQGLQV